MRSQPKRIAPPEEAERLLAALREKDKATWATALYAGLRRGELRGLRWECIDLAEGIIRVERGWDDLEEPIDLKSHAGRRRVPIAAALRDSLLDHKMRTGRSEGLVFGEDGETPFNPGKLTERADADWEVAGLERITLHACRHTFASYMIAAGVNAKALSSYMGHASISITLDLYGHLMPGNESEAMGCSTPTWRPSGKRPMTPLAVRVFPEVFPTANLNRMNMRNPGPSPRRTTSSAGAGFSACRCGLTLSVRQKVRQSASE